MKCHLSNIKRNAVSVWPVTIFCPVPLAELPTPTKTQQFWVQEGSTSRISHMAAVDRGQERSLLLLQGRHCCSSSLTDLLGLGRVPEPASGLRRWGICSTAPWLQGQQLPEPRASGKVGWEVHRDPNICWGAKLEEQPSNCWNSAKTYRAPPGQVRRVMGLKPSRFVGLSFFEQTVGFSKVPCFKAKWF